MNEVSPAQSEAMISTDQYVASVKPAAAKPIEGACTREELWRSIEKFTNWLERAGYATYDPYDVWGTGYGKLARRLYYQKQIAGMLLTAPLVATEILSPGVRSVLVKKDRYPTADAQLALGFLNLAEFAARQQRSQEPWLQKAKDLASDLLKQSVSGYSGYCWGYPFDWQNVNGLMPKNTPHITATPYCYEVFTRLFDLTGDAHYLQAARSIMAFVSEDLHDTATSGDAAASSYTPYDSGKVVNASAYRAFLLADASQRLSNETFLEQSWKNVRFILSSQRPDGSWLYAVDNPREAFIDHFHTCFVLKNLYKLNRVLKSDEVQRSLERGYRWYRKNLFDGSDRPQLYAVAPRVQTVRLEMYNFAEAISLGVLLRHDFPEAFALSHKLAGQLMSQHQLPGGYWVTRVYIGGRKHKVPFLRWPQSQLFLAMTNLLLA